MVTVWVIVLVNLFGMHIQELPTPYKSYGDCQIAIAEKHYADFNPLGLHGICETRIVQAPGTVIPN